MTNSRDCDQQSDQETQMEHHTNQQIDQPLLLEPIDLQEDPAPVAQDILLPEELQILQSVDSPSQVVTDKKELDEGENSTDQLEIEEQVQEEKEESLETREQNQDSQQETAKKSQEKTEEIKDTIQRDKDYEAELHRILGVPFADPTVPKRGLMAQVVYE